MEDEQFNITSQITTCPKCRTELELDATDVVNRRYTCPECGAKVGIEGTSIAKQATRFVHEGKIPIRFSQRLSFWYGPLIFIVPFIFLLSQTPPTDIALILFQLFFIAIGLYHAYRAIVSDRLTFVPSADPMPRKVEIVTKMQDKFRWTVSEGKDGAFVFIDKRGLNPREVLVICNERGYYINCMVHAWQAGSGVSIFDTRTIVKAIMQFSESGSK